MLNGYVPWYFLYSIQRKMFAVIDYLGSKDNISKVGS